MATIARRKAQQRQVSKNARANNQKLWRWGAVALGVVLGLGALWFWQQSATSYPAEISVTEAQAKQAAGAFILDVRQPDEWNAYHIAGATLIPLDQLASRLSELPTNQEIVVVCHSGNRSGKGRDILRTAGLTKVTSMAGGLMAWQAAGYATVSGP